MEETDTEGERAQRLYTDSNPSSGLDKGQRCCRVTVLPALPRSCFSLYTSYLENDTTERQIEKQTLSGKFYLIFTSQLAKTFCEFDLLGLYFSWSDQAGLCHSFSLTE